MLSCRDVTRLLSEEQDHALSLTQRVPLKMHLMMCKGCRNFAQQMQDLRFVTRAYVKGEGKNQGTGEEGK